MTMGNQELSFVLEIVDGKIFLLVNQVGMML